MRRTPMKAALAGCLAAAVFLPGAASAADPIRVITNGDAGWVINPDPANATEYAFTDEAASTGAGSLRGGPLGPGAAEKLIAALPLGMLVADLSSISYDFLIAGSGSAPGDADQFYLNVYVNAVNDGKFYDCRYDYVPASGSTSGFTTASFASTDTPTHVQKSGTGRIGTCPATLAGASGYFVRAIALNMGDTSANDNGLVGYFDNVVIETTSGTTTYDFEPGTKDDCKNGNWASHGFTNQGSCVSYVTAGK